MFYCEQCAPLTPLLTANNILKYYRGYTIVLYTLYGACLPWSQAGPGPGPQPRSPALTDGKLGRLAAPCLPQPKVWVTRCSALGPWSWLPACLVQWPALLSARLVALPGAPTLGSEWRVSTAAGLIME